MMFLDPHTKSPIYNDFPYKPPLYDGSSKPCLTTRMNINFEQGVKQPPDSRSLVSQGLEPPNMIVSLPYRSNPRGKVMAVILGVAKENILVQASWMVGKIGGS